MYMLLEAFVGYFWIFANIKLLFVENQALKTTIII